MFKEIYSTSAHFLFHQGHEGVIQISAQVRGNRLRVDLQH